MKLTVATYESHQYGTRRVLKEIDVVGIRALKASGVGDASISYQAKSADGTWYEFLKKENPGARGLPVARQLKWKPAKLIGLWSYGFASEEYPV